MSGCSRPSGLGTRASQIAGVLDKLDYYVYV